MGGKAKEWQRQGRALDYTDYAAESYLRGAFQDPGLRGFYVVLDDDQGTRLGTADFRERGFVKSGKIGKVYPLGNEKYRYRQKERQQIFPVYERVPKHHASMHIAIYQKMQDIMSAGAAWFQPV
ncbi:MAG TPA: hypothetical protein VJ550_09270 [Geomonas sp.]|nr:hypothetical protein [Geomonas sp.]